MDDGLLVDVNLLNYYHNKISTEFFTEGLEANEGDLKTLSTTELTAAYGAVERLSINTLAVTGTATLNKLTVNGALSVPSLTANALNVSELTASNRVNSPGGYFGTVNSDAIQSASISGDTGSFTKLTAQSLNATRLSADNLSLTGSISVPTIEATNVRADYIRSKGQIVGTTGVFDTVNANYISATSDVTANHGEFDSLKVGVLDVDNFTTDYIRADGANITDAVIENLFADTGVFEEAIIRDGTITGYLNATHIRADSIVANKIKLLGNDGLYYALNTNGVTGEGQDLTNALDGSHILADSITASKIAVSDLFAFNAKIGGWSIDRDAIRSQLKHAYDDNSPGVYLGSGTTDVAVNVDNENGVGLTDENGEQLYFNSYTADDVKIGWRCQPDANQFVSYLLYSKEGIEIMTPNFKVNRTTGAVTVNGTFTIGPSSTLSDGTTNVNTAISGAVSDAANAVSAVSDIQDAIENGDFDGEDATVLRIDSTRGNMFKNNEVSTVLNVTVFSGPDVITTYSDLTAKYGASAYLQWYWQRIGETTFHEILSTDSKISNYGFSLTLTPSDVDTKVTFMCKLIV